MQNEPSKLLRTSSRAERLTARAIPSFIALRPTTAGGSLRRSGFLPSEFQGTHFNQSEEDPEKMIRYLRNKQLAKFRPIVNA